ncbi:hypothetical protein GOV04_00045 [Candidatus Woesearchaeota archaeon]|nr:hypothetical protein [Candidatus Woesearchaeota archaeon]
MIVHENSAKILALLDEVRQQLNYKAQAKKDLDALFKKYQSGKLNYLEYETTVKNNYESRTPAEVIEYYNAIIYQTLKYAQHYNDDIFTKVFEDIAYTKLSIKPIEKPKAVVAPVIEPEPKKHKIVKKYEKDVLTELDGLEAIKEQAKTQKPKPATAKTFKLPKLTLSKRPIVLPTRKPQRPTAQITPAQALKAQKPPTPRPQPTQPISTQKHKLSFSERVKMFFSHKKIPKPLKPEATIQKKRFFASIKNTIRMLLTGGKELITDQTAVSHAAKELEKLQHKAKIGASDKLAGTLLSQEVKRIKSIMVKRSDMKIYQPTLFGEISNLLTRKISFYMIDSMPEVFKRLYNNMRYANIKILSNTYVNMLVLVSIMAGFVTFFIAGLYNFFTKKALVMILFNTFAITFLFILLTGASFFWYPIIKLKDRKKSINTNLPFVITHMAAVANSGVPPAKMFRLISESQEYGEISVEVEKIVEYVELFGYDIVTAVRSVASTTPSPDFREFFEGMVSTIESGGNLKDYLGQKADETMLTYELERQKYNETVATYSDIYTGILIAAPLFFIAALSLISLLGGTVAGFEINTIVVFGTYLAVPLLNILFIIFLELTQPDV